MLTRNTWVVGIIKWASFWRRTNQTWRVIILPKPPTEFKRLGNTPLTYELNYEPLYTSIPYWPSKWSLCFSPNSCSEAVAEALLLFSHIVCVILLFVFIFLKLLMMPSILQLLLEKERVSMPPLFWLFPVSEVQRFLIHHFIINHELLIKTYSKLPIRITIFYRYYWCHLP